MVSKIRAKYGELFYRSSLDTRAILFPVGKYEPLITVGSYIDDETVPGFGQRMLMRFVDDGATVKRDLAIPLQDLDEGGVPQGDGTLGKYLKRMGFGLRKYNGLGVRGASDRNLPRLLSDRQPLVAYVYEPMQSGVTVKAYPEDNEVVLFDVDFSNGRVGDQDAERADANQTEPEPFRSYGLLITPVERRLMKRPYASAAQGDSSNSTAPVPRTTLSYKVLEGVTYLEPQAYTSVSLEVKYSGNPVNRETLTELLKRIIAERTPYLPPYGTINVCAYADEKEFKPGGHPSARANVWPPREPQFTFPNKPHDGRYSR